MNPEVNLHASPTAVNQEQTPAQREWVKPAAKVADVSVATMNTPTVHGSDLAGCAS